MLRQCAWILAAASCAAQTREWPASGGSRAQMRYSPLDQINRENVKRIEAAWTFDTGDAFTGSEMQCNPLVVKGVLYLTSPKLRIFALDAATGKQRWVFDPSADRPVKSKMRNRGLTYAKGRIYFGFRQWLYALDVRTGRPAPKFGVNGRVDLREGLGRPAALQQISMTTPGVVYGNLLIVGSIMSEDLPAPPGDIRAYDLDTGRLVWSFRIRASRATRPGPRTRGPTAAR